MKGTATRKNHLRVAITVSFTLLVMLLASTAVDAGWQTSGVLAEGKKHETSYYVYDSGVPGPTVAVIGGMHGDEVAGYRAAQTIKNWAVETGRLLVVPELNKMAVKAGTRESSVGDLNRSFPRNRKESPDNFLAKDVFDLMERYEPDYLLDLHEGYDFHLQNSSSVGQTVIFYPRGNSAALAERMAEAMTRTVSNAKHSFTTLKYPVSGSLARAVSIKLGAIGMIVETSDKQPLATRIGQHQTAVWALLSELGMRE